MASLKIIQWNRPNKDGTNTLYYNISHNGGQARIKTEVSIRLDQWDRERQEVINHPNKRQFNQRLLSRKWDIEEIIEKLKGVKRMSAVQLRDTVEKELYGQEDGGVIFLEYYESVLRTYANKRTRELHEATIKWIRKADIHSERLTFEDITPAWLTKLEVAMAGTKVNSISIHLRNIRAIINRAITEELTNNYPFRRYKIKKEATIKRSVSAERMRDIMTCDVPEPWMQRYADFFRLQFLLIGINTIDLCDNATIDGNYIVYRRAKTKRLYKILIQPEAQELINKYKNEDRVYDYSVRCEVTNYRHFSGRLQACIKNLWGVTPYWARHTWATIAASLDIPKETIAAALGHGGNTVTDIYIDFDQRKVDEANRKVIDFVWYNKL